MYEIEFIDTEGKRRFLKTNEIGNGLTPEAIAFIVKREYNKQQSPKNRINGVKKIVKIREVK